MTEQATDTTTKPKKTEALAKAEARIAELEGRLAAGEEGQLTRVCKALGVNPDEIKAKEASAPAPEEMIDMHVHYPVNINGRVYHGHVRVGLATSRVIHQALGNRRERLMKEMIGNTTIYQELANGRFGPKVEQRVGINGEILR